MLKIEYDYIIYGASLPGCLLAERLAENGHSVLLLNEYGFPGGSMTESLNCYQNTFFISPKVDKVISEINENKPGTFRRIEDVIFFNPESVKFAAQKILDKSEVDLLFHVRIIDLSRENKRVNLEVSGKEGTLNFNCKRLIDATDGHLLSNIISENSASKNIEYNVIATGLKEIDCKSLPHKNRTLSLDDGRVYINFKYEIDDILFIENFIQKEISKIDLMIKNIGGRIQLLPAQANIIYNICSNKNNDHFIDIETILGRSFKVDELLTKASMTSELELSKL